MTPKNGQRNSESHSDCVAVLGFINGQAAAADPLKEHQTQQLFALTERSLVLTVTRPSRLWSF